MGALTAPLVAIFIIVLFIAKGVTLIFLGLITASKLLQIKILDENDTINKHFRNSFA